MKIGDIQGMAVCPENTFVIACGGDNKSNNFGVWDLRVQEQGNIFYNITFYSYLKYFLYFSSKYFWSKRSNSCYELI